MVLVKKGRIRYRVLEQERVMDPGDAILVGSHVQHSALAYSNAHAAALSCRFDLPEPAHSDDDFAIHLKLHQADEIIRRWEECHIWYRQQNQELHRHLINHRMTELLFAMAYHASQAQSMDPRLQWVHDLMIRDCRRRWQLEELAATVDLSGKQLSRLFKQQFNYPIMAWLIRERCRQAAAMLRDSDASVAAIADSFGYPDAFSFSKQFRQVMGQAPSHYRQRDGS